MPSSATLLDYLTTADIVVFLGVPLCLLTIVLAQQLLASRTAAGFGGSYPTRPAPPPIAKDSDVRSKSLPGRPAPRK